MLKVVRLQSRPFGQKRLPLCLPFSGVGYYNYGFPGVNSQFSSNHFNLTDRSDFNHTYVFFEKEAE